MLDEMSLRFHVVNKLPIPFPSVNQGEEINTVFDPDAHVPQEIGVYMTPGRVSNFLESLHGGWNIVVRVSDQGSVLLAEHTRDEWLERAAEHWRQVKYHVSQASYHRKRMLELMEAGVP